jgi:hypothetical protein
MKQNKPITIKKVHLDSFIEILIDLYDKGVDYVDIIGVNNEVQDSIGISFSKSYMNSELIDNFEKIKVPVKKTEKKDSEPEININLSDDDLNQLL